MMLDARWMVVATLLAIGGCTSDVADPPALLGLPHERTLEEGSTEAIAFDVATGGQEVTLQARSSRPELRAAVRSDPLELSIEAGFGMVEPGEVTVRAETAGGEADAQTIEVRVDPLRWRSRYEWTDEDGPEAREHPAVIVDEAGRRALVIAGNGYSPHGEPLDDAWSYDLEGDGGWSPLRYEGELPAGTSRRAATVGGERTAYLFGGTDAAGEVTNELVRVSFGEEVVVFESVEQVNPPPARALHGFVYDPDGEAFYVFGGFAATGPVLGDTWRMTLDDEGVAHWDKLELPDAPEPRYGFFYAFDPEARRMMVFSGGRDLRTIDPARDLWALQTDGESARWTLLLEGDDAPPGRRNGTTVFDPTRQRLYVFGGTPDGRTSVDGLYVIDVRPGAERFGRVERDGAPPMRSSGSGWLDPVRDRVYMGFGNSARNVYRDVAVLSH